MNTRDEILKFRRESPGSYGTENPSTPSDLDQLHGLQEARLLAVAQMLEVEAETLLRILDHLIWDSDLSDQALSSARGELGLGDPVFLTPGEMITFLDALQAPQPIVSSLRRAFFRRGLLSLLALREAEWEAGEVRPATEVFQEIRRRTQVPTESEEAEDVEESDLPKRTPEQRAELNAAIQKVAESFPPRAANDFDAIAAALEAMWKKK